MKSITIILMACTLSIGCNKESNDEKKDTLIGKWQLVEEYVYDISNGTEGWLEVSTENSFTIEFNENNTFKSTKYNECNYGEYIYNEIEITMDYGCEDFTIGIETPPGTFIESYSFLSPNLILSPKYMSCAEGCSYKFKKIESGE